MNFFSSAPAWSLLDEVRASRASADAAEVRILQLAVAWAEAHPDSSGAEPFSTSVDLDLDDPRVDDHLLEWRGVPGIRWDAPAAFATANAMSTQAGQALIRDALVLRHRLPDLWERVLADQVPSWRARRVAQAVLGEPDDVVAYVDGKVAPIAHRVGARTLDRIIDEAMLHLYPEERELSQLEALDARYVTLHDQQINHTGVCDLTVRADWKDVHDFDQTVAAVAAALAAQGCLEPLDVRRSMAVGVLADPAVAQALLEGEDGDAAGSRKQIVLQLRISDLALLGLDPAGWNDTTARPMLEQQIREWCGRTDTRVSVLPVVDLAARQATDAYEIPARMSSRVRTRHTTCVFPWCTQSSWGCDLDHIVPFACGGPTTDDNLAPLCRRHHRLKTFAGWCYERTGDDEFAWIDPWGHPVDTRFREPAGRW